MSIQFNQLPVAGSVNPTDEIAIDQAGVTRRAEVSLFASGGAISVNHNGTLVQAGVTTINITGFNATVTAGANNTATIDITAPGDSDTLVVTLAPIGAAVFQGALYSDWTGTTHGGSNGSHWDQATQKVVFDTEGLYEISMQASVATSPGINWPATGLTDSVTLYGSEVPEAIGMALSEYGRKPANPLSSSVADPKRAQWHDTFIVDATTLPKSFTPKVYADNYSDGAGVTAVFAVMLSVKRIWIP